MHSLDRRESVFASRWMFERASMQLIDALASFPQAINQLPLRDALELEFPQTLCFDAAQAHEFR